MLRRRIGNWTEGRGAENEGQKALDSRYIHTKLHFHERVRPATVDDVVKQLNGELTAQSILRIV